MHKQDGAQTHMFVAYTLSAPTSYISVVLPFSLFLIGTCVVL